MQTATIALDAGLRRRMVNRLVKCGCTREQAEQTMDATVDFLCRAAGNPTVPTPQEDRGWHNFLLFQREYEAFCIQNFGRVIYHSPFDHNADGECTSDG